MAIIGGGFGGIAIAAELMRHGQRDFVVLEKATEAGGVWRENTYPGAGCDVPSPLYSYSFEPNPEWPMRFSLQPEIHAYVRHVADKYGITPRIRFGTEVSEARWDAASGRWQIETTSGEVIDAAVLVPAMGQLSRPAMPNIPGRDTFAGPSFHSATWDHDCQLAGKRVAVIGTGASAIQFVPRIQPVVDELTLFQRTPPHIVPKPDREYRPVHHRLFRRLPIVQRFERLLWFLFCELSTLAIVGNKIFSKAVGLIASTHLRHQVPDPKLRAKLTPDYRIGCKRVLFADNYYPALAEPNVHVETAAITEITPAGVRTADGAEHPADVIIYATGFATREFLAPVRIVGPGGEDLRTHWADGARAYLGIAVEGFPNLFLMYGPNTNLGANSIIYMLERQARYIRQLIERVAAAGGNQVEVRAHVARAFDDEMQRRLERTAWAGCSSWYREANGRITSNWPGLVSEYDRRTRRPDPAAFDVRSTSPVTLG